MSTKRTATESSNDDQTTQVSDPVSQQQGDAKRAKVVSLSDTTLQNLPTELVECILVKVVAMEVKDMRLARCVWNEKSELVINRLRTVCSQWSSLCVTKYFRNEVHRTLDDTAHDAIRLEILHQYPIQLPVYEVTTMKDEIFMLCSPDGRDYSMNVFDCRNIGVVKDFIPLPPGVNPGDIVGCNVSNCVYVLDWELDESNADSVLRIKKAEEHQFTLSRFIRLKPSDLHMSSLDVSVNGNLIILSTEARPDPTVVRIYASNGFLQQEVVLSPDIYGFSYVASVIQKSNGNLVLAWYDDDDIKAQLREIDTFGNVVRRYQTGFLGEIGMNVVDMYDRIFITSWQSRFELIDSELNRLDFTGVQHHDGQFYYPSNVHFNGERNEIMYFYRLNGPSRVALAIFRFI